MVLFSLYRNLGQAETEILQWWRCSWLTCRGWNRSNCGCLNWSSSQSSRSSKLHVNSNRCMCLFALITGAFFLLQTTLTVGGVGLLVGGALAYALMKPDSMTEEEAKYKVTLTLYKFAWLVLEICPPYALCALL